MKTLIISGFPGTGKSVLFGENQDLVSDSDSSSYSWITDEDGNKSRNPEFPNNYIEHIKSLMGKKKIICVSTHDSVRKALKENGIEYILVYPTRSCKPIYLENYKNRGNEQVFIDMMDRNWDKFIDELEAEDGCTMKMSLMKNTYIKDIPGIMK
jgi:nucleoside-triphosphatase THEP1